MIRIERIKLDRVIASELIAEAARAFLSDQGKRFSVTDSWGMYDDDLPLLYGGIAAETMLARPELWALPCTTFALHPLRNMRALRMAIREYAPANACMWVTTGSDNMRFAQLLGAVEDYTVLDWTRMILQ